MKRDEEDDEQETYPEDARNVGSPSITTTTGILHTLAANKEPAATAAFAAKMARVMASVGYLEKGGTNAHFKYKFVEASSAFAAFREALVGNGLAIVGTRPTLERLVWHAGMYLAVMRLELHVADVDTGHVRTFAGIGSGSDRQDKCTMKAATASAKYAVMLAVLASSGDDPEADEATDRGAGGRTRKRRGQRGAEAARAAEPEPEPSATAKPKRVTKKQQVADALAALTADIAACADRDGLRAVRERMLDYAGAAGFAEVRQAYLARVEALS